MSQVADEDEVGGSQASDEDGDVTTDLAVVPFEERYDKVRVLLTRWEVEYDKDPNDGSLEENTPDFRKKQIQDLTKTFKKSYGFEVKRYLIKDDKPVIGLKKAIQDQADDLEPAKRGLLIFVYTGHGGRTISDDKPPGPLRLSNRMARFSWDKVLDALKRTDCDVLVCLQCCFSGSVYPSLQETMEGKSARVKAILKGSHGLSKISPKGKKMTILTACLAEQKTSNSPREELISWTGRLNEALVELRKEIKSDSSFKAFTLAQEIDTVTEDLKQEFEEERMKIVKKRKKTDAEKEMLKKRSAAEIIHWTGVDDGGCDIWINPLK